MRVRGFFASALARGAVPVEATTDRAPAHPRVLDELIPTSAPMAPPSSSDTEWIWVKAFIASRPDFPDAYAKALAKSKGRMRQHAYGR